MVIINAQKGKTCRVMEIQLKDNQMETLEDRKYSV